MFDQHAYNLSLEKVKNNNETLQQENHELRARNEQLEKVLSDTQKFLDDAVEENECLQKEIVKLKQKIADMKMSW